MGLYHGISPSSSLRSSKTLLIPCALFLAFFFVFIYSPLPARYDDHRDAVLSHIADAAKGHFLDAMPHEAWHPTGLEHVKAKHAFATFLTGPSEDDSAEANIENDHYFTATRILAYQLLHAPETRSSDEDIPFVVLVTDRVSEEKRLRLRKDGAIVIAADFIRADWVHTATSTWQDVMTKLRLWELVQFEHVCFLDGDTVLVEPLDGVFEDPAVSLRGIGSKEKHILADEASMPTDYSFAGVPEMKREHGFPPTDANHDFPNNDYLNAGFFVFSPSLDIFQYYLSILEVPNKFNPEMPEQNLLNYAHRREGNMPWTQLRNDWNIHYPTVDDLLGGVKSLHEKWWAPVTDDLRPYLESWRWRMEGHFEARDRLFAKQYQATGLDPASSFAD